jgi:hypothetical protein
MISRAIRLLLASGFLAAVAHVAPVAERAALGITRVEDLAPEAIARPLGEIRAACRVGRLARRIEGQSESGDACGLRESPGTLPNPALTPGAVRTADPGDVCGDRSTRQYRHWSRARDDRILAEYGWPDTIEDTNEETAFGCRSGLVEKDQPMRLKPHARLALGGFIYRPGAFPTRSAPGGGHG